MASITSLYFSNLSQSTGVHIQTWALPCFGNLQKVDLLKQPGASRSFPSLPISQKVWDHCRGQGWGGRSEPTGKGHVRIPSCSDKSHFLNNNNWSFIHWAEQSLTQHMATKVRRSTGSLRKGKISSKRNNLQYKSKYIANTSVKCWNTMPSEGLSRLKYGCPVSFANSGADWALQAGGSGSWSQMLQKTSLLTFLTVHLTELRKIRKRPRWKIGHTLTQNIY